MGSKPVAEGFTTPEQTTGRASEGAVTPVVVTLRGGIKEVDMGDWKPGDKPLKVVNL